MDYAEVCYNLGLIYGYGEGVKQDSQKTKEYFSKACDLGNQDACKGHKSLNEIEI